MPGLTLVSSTSDTEYYVESITDAQCCLAPTPWRPGFNERYWVVYKKKNDYITALHSVRYYAWTDYLHVFKFIGSYCTAFGIDCTAYLCNVSFRYVRVQV